MVLMFINFIYINKAIVFMLTKVPLPKNTRAAFTGSNSRPISLLPVMSKLLEKIVFDQIQCYFSMNNLTSIYQHAYREGHSTSTALTQMTDDWLKDIDQQNIVVQCYWILVPPLM